MGYRFSASFLDEFSYVSDGFHHSYPIFIPTGEKSPDQVVSPPSKKFGTLLPSEVLSQRPIGSIMIQKSQKRVHIIGEEQYIFVGRKYSSSLRHFEAHLLKLVISD